MALELTAVNQYFLQAKMCQNWGYKGLGGHHFHESIDEMKHAEKLIERILFLEGSPNISKYNPIRVGTGVKEQLENDLLLETDAVKIYNEAIEACLKAKDAGTREIFEELLEGSEEAVDWLETQLHLIKDIGPENYLAEQLETPAKS
jgi:bacterioferritin